MSTELIIRNPPSIYTRLSLERQKWFYFENCARHHRQDNISQAKREYFQFIPTLFMLKTTFKPPKRQSISSMPL